MKNVTLIVLKMHMKTRCPRFNAIPIKISAGFFVETDKLVLKRKTKLEDSLFPIVKHTTKLQ